MQAYRFAVAANEVRPLAMRTASAAKDSARIIEDTQIKVQEGETGIQHTNETFEKLNESATHVAELISTFQKQVVSNQEVRMRLINQCYKLMNLLAQTQM